MRRGDKNEDHEENEDRKGEDENEEDDEERANIQMRVVIWNNREYFEAVAFMMTKSTATTLANHRYW